eukprot:CAMPEP_0179054326 /NCGR_PEP_ID=MMETSP0796-20121207/22727_1 /TAXON_ID=73915 /ORGANISM="Pyrodinium bahamense, Strain pbaha01" /LENGTH=611 /DNA_ID=CAMNT_0020750943 /DNA_START=262 /DNA_END=2097 /DNA_ORIENTATION=-
MQWAINELGICLGVLCLAAMCMCFSLLGVCIIECFAKNCGGSGLPENKCYLNGSPMEGFFTGRTLLVRVSTSILANAAGYPVGREGPTVVIGSNVAYLISRRLLTLTGHVHNWVAGGKESYVMIVDEERMAQATRIACAVGGACGIGMIFNSPIGGLLYMFEEITSVSWPLELTLRAFVGTTACAMISYYFLSVWKHDIKEFVIFAWEPRDDEWMWVDVPWFVVLAATLGVITSVHTRGLLYVARCRKRRCSSHRYARILETVLYAAFCAFSSAFASLVGSCTEGYPGINAHVQFNCPAGAYNPVATLLVNTSHSAVRLLFDCQNVGDFGPRSTAFAFVVYYTLNVGLSGLPVPGGAFTGTMLLGGLLGRCAGSLLDQYSGIEGLANPGIYSLVGCAAMLCGFKQMTAAVVLICIQCVNNVHVSPVVMLSVSVAMAVNRLINKKGHDEQQIEGRKLPFLAPEVPDVLVSVPARDLCDSSPVRLHEGGKLADLIRALRSQVAYFPVFDEQGSQCIGIVDRKHLEAIGLARNESLRACEVEAPGSSGAGGTGTVPITSFMDPTPFTIPEDMPAERFYKIFSKEGEKAACVVSPTGEFIGIISRWGLIEASYAQ